MKRSEDRRADLVAKVKPAQGDRFILHLEIQNANDGQMWIVETTPLSIKVKAYILFAEVLADRMIWAGGRPVDC